MTVKVNLKTVRNAVSKRKAFNCNGTLTGDWAFRKPLTGRMHPDSVKEFDGMFLNNDETFIIKSYDTPIAAWNKTYGWWISADKHSVTTSRHQSAIRAGIN